MLSRLAAHSRRFGSARVVSEQKIVSCPVKGISMVTKEKHLTFADQVRLAFMNTSVQAGERMQLACADAKMAKDLFLYGEKFVERSKRLTYCPVQGFTKNRRATVFRGMVRRYEVLDRESPLLSKFAIAATCALAGEVVVQHMKGNAVAADASHPANSTDPNTALTAQEEIEAVNANRRWALPLINMAYVGFGVNGWCLLMNRLFPSASLRHVTYKTVATTLGLNPLYTLAFVGGTHLLLESNRNKRFSERWPEGKELCSAAFISTPLIYGVQFFLIPAQKHVLYLVGVNFAFNVYASKTLQ